jgi:hypothetical protein
MHYQLAALLAVQPRLLLRSLHKNPDSLEVTFRADESARCTQDTHLAVAVEGPTV